MGQQGPIFRLPPVTVEAMYLSLAETIDWGLKLLGVPETWRVTQGEGVRVAVLDTGIEADHPDLQGAIVDARDFTRSRSGTTDRAGHGTHVAGTIAARRNETGVVGVAPRCRLLVGKVLGDDGSGSAAGVAAGIDWAVAAGAEVLSLSLGSPDYSVEIATAIDRAVAAGRFVICAAGNTGKPNSIDFPGKLPQVVTVGAIDRAGRLARFSSRGPELDICAPGTEVLSTYLNGGYARLSGTSMATPFVSGVVALLLARHRDQPGRTPVTNQRQLLEHLARTARDAGAAGPDDEFGHGLIDPARMLHAPTTVALEWGPVVVNGVTGRLVFQPGAADLV